MTRDMRPVSRRRQRPLLRKFTHVPTRMKPVHQLSDDEFAALAHEAARLPGAPQTWLEAALGLWPEPSAQPLREAARAALRVIHAALRFDSWAQPSVALGMRSAGMHTSGSEVRHLVLGCENRDIDLRIAREAERQGSEHFTISGQVLGPGDAGSVELRNADGSELRNADGVVLRGDANHESLSATLDDLGEFQLRSVRAGTYVLSLRFGHDEVVLPPIQIGPGSTEAAVP